MRFENREDAGRRLSDQLDKVRDKRPVVLALPRGGVPVALPVARALRAPLDVWVVKKLGAPGQPELGIGAVSEGGVVHVDRASPQWAGASDAEIDGIIAQKTREVEERIRRYRRGLPPPDLRGRAVVVVDDGMATGQTMSAAVDALRAQEPERIVVAVPVAATSSLDELRTRVDGVHCLVDTHRHWPIGAWYAEFPQVGDKEVLALLDQGRGQGAQLPAQLRGDSERPPGSERPPESEISILVGSVVLGGSVVVPPGARGLVVFAHGSGSGRFSPRTRFIAGELQRRGIATAAFDLLTPDEEALDEGTPSLRFDVELLTQRLLGVTDWARKDAATRALEIGYLGSSTGAAAALVAASYRPEVVRAIVSRGGRPDLAGERLDLVRAPTLLLVGARDEAIFEPNRRAVAKLEAGSRLQLVPSATHLFEEPGALEDVATEAADWFERHFESPIPRQTRTDEVRVPR